MHTGFLGELLQSEVTSSSLRRGTIPDHGALRSKHLSPKKLLDNQRVERGFLRRSPAFGIEIVGDLLGGCPLSTQHRDATHYFVVMFQLFKTLARHPDGNAPPTHDQISARRSLEWPFP